MKHRTDQLLLVVLVILVVCYFVFVKKDSSDGLSHNNIPRIDTGLQVVNAQWEGSAFPMIFEAAFREGTTLLQGENEHAFSTFWVGDLNVVSGKLICCDNVNIFNALPFTERFPVGKFRVELAMIDYNAYSSVAMARVVFKNDTVTKWRYALLPGQTDTTIGGQNIYCYPVDAATALFIDSVANDKLSEMREGDWKKVFRTHDKRHFQYGFMSAFFNHNMAVFNSGRGDGCYATYIGYNRKDEICYLLTDFALVQWWK